MTAITAKTTPTWQEFEDFVGDVRQNGGKLTKDQQAAVLLIAQAIRVDFKALRDYAESAGDGGLIVKLKMLERKCSLLRMALPGAPADDGILRAREWKAGGVEVH